MMSSKNVNYKLAACALLSTCLVIAVSAQGMADVIPNNGQPQESSTAPSKSIADVIASTVAATQSATASEPLPQVPSETTKGPDFTPVPPEPNTPFDTKPIFTQTTSNVWPGAKGGAGKPAHFYGLSYSPFGLGDNKLCPPFDDVGGFCLLPSQVEKDMLGLSMLTRRIKTYSTVCGLATKQIFASAREYKMTIMMGVWITPNVTANSLEINRMMPFVKYYHDIISHIMVGNEPVFVLKTPPKVVASAIEEVRRRLKEDLGVTNIPIGCADIYNTWMGTPVGGKDKIAFDVKANDMTPIVTVSDYIGLNAHAYWGGIDPTTRKAGIHVMDGVESIKTKWKKPVLITETGYPTVGEARTTEDGTAKPGEPQLSLFANDIEVESRKRKVPVFYFEPYNGDWKRRWEPYVEMDYSFGLAYCNRTMKSINLPPVGAL